MPELTGAGEEPIPIGPATQNAEVVIDDAVHPRPLVPREAAPETDGGVRTGEAVGIAGQFLPGRAELDLIEAAVSSCQGVALKEKSALEQVRMRGGGQNNSHSFYAGQKKQADLIGT